MTELLGIVDFLRKFEEDLEASSLNTSPIKPRTPMDFSTSKPTSPSSSASPKQQQPPRVSAKDLMSFFDSTPPKRISDDSALHCSILDLSDLPDSPKFRTKMNHSLLSPRKTMSEANTSVLSKSQATDSSALECTWLRCHAD